MEFVSLSRKATTIDAGGCHNKQNGQFLTAVGVIISCSVRWLHKLADAMDVVSLSFTGGYMATFSSAITDPRRKNMQIATCESDHRLLQGLSEESGLPQGVILHILLELVHLRVDAAKESTEIDPDASGSVIEVFIWLLLHDLGLVTEHELGRALVLADAYPARHVAERLGAAEDLAKERLARLKPMWAERRRKLVEWGERWDAEHASEPEPESALLN